MTESNDNPPPRGSDNAADGSSVFDEPFVDDLGSIPGQQTPSEPARRFRRSSDGSLGGIATGIAHYFGIDPLLAKIIMFGAMFLSGGSLFLAYLAAWLLVPADDDPNPRPFAITTSVAPLVLGSLLAIGVVSLWVSDSGPGGSLIVPSLLVVGGVFLLNQQGEDSPAQRSAFGAPRTAATPPPQPPPPFQPAPPTAASSSYGWATPRLDNDGPPSGPTAPTEPEVPKPPITAVTLAATAIAIGLLALIDQLGASIGVRAYAGAATAIIGLGLIVSSVFGRAWRLIPLGILTAAAILIGPIIDGAASGGFGPKEVTVISEENLRSNYSVGGGYYELDLSGLTLTEDRTVNVDVGAGYAEIRVPSDMNVEIEAESSFGYVDLFGREVAGVGNSSSASFGTDDGPTLTVIAETEFGYVEVTR